MQLSETKSPSGQFLAFYLGDEAYAVGILRVREILQLEKLTRVPRTPPWIRGVINLRGSVVPVVDLGVKFGRSPSPQTPESCVVLLETNVDGQPTVTGILADAVDQVITLSDGDIQPPPSFGTRVRVDFLLGMGSLGEEFVLILDIERVLSLDELLTAASVAEEASAPGDADAGAATRSESDDTPGEGEALAVPARPIRRRRAAPPVSATGEGSAS